MCPLALPSCCGPVAGPAIARLLKTFRGPGYNFRVCSQRASETTSPLRQFRSSQRLGLLDGKLLMLLGMIQKVIRSLSRRRRKDRLRFTSSVPRINFSIGYSTSSFSPQSSSDIIEIGRYSLRAKTSVDGCVSGDFGFPHLRFCTVTNSSRGQRPNEF
jgi:hypothetical protein